MRLWGRNSPADSKVSAEGGGGDAPGPEQIHEVREPEGGCGLVGSPSWSRLLAGPVDPCTEEPLLEEVCWQDLWPRGGLKLEQFAKNCSPWDGFMLEKFMADYLPWEGPHTGAVEECEESSLRRKEWQRQGVMNWPLPFPIPLHCCQEGGEFGSEAGPRKKGGVGEGIFKIWFYFPLPCSDFD